MRQTIGMAIGTLERLRSLLDGYLGLGCLTLASAGLAAVPGSLWGSCVLAIRCQFGKVELAPA